MDKKNNKSAKTNTDEIKNFLAKYWGAMLGGIIALILACSGAYRVIIAIVIIGAGIWAGNYFQYNRNNIKNNLKNFIDKL